MLLKNYEKGNLQLQRAMDLKIKQLAKSATESKVSMKKLEQGLNTQFKDLTT